MSNRQRTGLPPPNTGDHKSGRSKRHLAQLRPVPSSVPRPRTRLQAEYELDPYLSADDREREATLRASRRDQDPDSLLEEEERSIDEYGSHSLREDDTDDSNDHDALESSHGSSQANATASPRTRRKPRPVWTAEECSELHRLLNEQDPSPKLWRPVKDRLNLVGNNKRTLEAVKTYARKHGPPAGWKLGEPWEWNPAMRKASKAGRGRAGSGEGAFSRRC